MSKSKKEVNNNELLTLLPKKEKQEIVKPKEVKTESSVFNNVIQEKTLISITEQNVNTPLLPEKLKKAEVIIFEFTYLDLPSKVETTIYTYTEPTIKSNGIILITEAFGRQSFEENILGILPTISKESMLTCSTVFLGRSLKKRQNTIKMPSKSSLQASLHLSSVLLS